MSNESELLVLRLALIAILFLFVFGVALMMRSGVTAKAPARAAAPRRAERVAPRLVVVVPARTSLTPGDEFDLVGTMTIGRDAGNGIILADPSVSGRHAAIERTRTGWRLTDLGSTNGTFVNGRPIDGRGVLLGGGEQVSLGSVVLRFQP